MVDLSPIFIEEEALQGHICEPLLTIVFLPIDIFEGYLKSLAPKKRTVE